MEGGRERERERKRENEGERERERLVTPAQTVYNILPSSLGLPTDSRKGGNIFN